MKRAPERSGPLGSGNLFFVKLQYEILEFGWAQNLIYNKIFHIIYILFFVASEAGPERRAAPLGSGNLYFALKLTPYEI